MSKKRRSVVRRSNEPANIGRPLTTPLSSSVVYHYSDVDQLKAVYEKKAEGFTYARYGNPNAAVLAEKISWMENAQGGVMTASDRSERLKLGIEDNLIRVSVGIESFDIIQGDFLEALDAA